MFVYLFVVLLLYIFWRAKDYIFVKEFKNFSTTSTPLIKNSFNMAYKSQGLIWLSSTKVQIFFKSFPHYQQRKFFYFYVNVLITYKHPTLTGSSDIGPLKCVGQRMWSKYSDPRSTSTKVISLNLILYSLLGRSITVRIYFQAICTTF